MTHTKPAQDFPLRETIKRFRAKQKMTQKQLAERLGISPVTVSGWEIGKRTPEPQMLPRIAAIFGISVDNLLGQTNKADSIRAADGVAFVPVYGSVAVREGRLAFLDFCGTYPLPLEDATVPRGVQAIFLPVSDASMALAGLSVGAMVLVHANDKVCTGDLCVAVIDGSRQVLRRCIKNQPDIVTLQAADAAIPDEVFTGSDRARIHLVGPCVATYQSLPRGNRTS